jgi:hypothetical protein
MSENGLKSPKKAILIVSESHFSVNSGLLKEKNPAAPNNRGF